MRALIQILVATAWFSNGVFASEHGDAADLRHFEQHVRPVLSKHCLECHGATKQKGGLRLDSREAILVGGDSGAALIPGEPASSLLLSALRYQDLEMPPDGALSSETINQIEKWIQVGAPWPENITVLRHESDRISEADRSWWAFRPVHKPELPIGLTGTRVQNPIDQFVGAALEQQQLKPAPEAPADILVRRAYLDVIGLPPTLEDVAQYQNDQRADRWERLIDRLLADPRHGEHWARHWLDLVRYSDSDGWNQDAFRPEIWRYRDYVINAFNDNKPYPQFVREQLAGDESTVNDPEALTATGFLRLGIYEYNQRDARGHWNDIMNEMTDVAGDVFFGMSMACARCHDHKFDPVLQKDYFRLRSFFEPIIWRDDLVAATEQQKEDYQKQLRIWETETRAIRSQIDTLLKPYYDQKWVTTVDKFPLDIQACFNRSVSERNSWDHQMAYLVSRQFMEEGGGPLKEMSKEDKAQHKALLADLSAFDHLRPQPLPKIMAASDFAGTLSPTRIPGDSSGESITPGMFSVLANQGDKLSIQKSHQGSGRRTALARWIGSDSNGLTSRVIVNRIWQQHFGQGLVATPNDFGHNGKRPTHPELLDWLTARFVESDWNLKSLHRLILNSQTWKQSSQHPNAKQNEEIDPSESFLWRHRVRRLSAEQIRDAMLRVSGELSTRVGGPSRGEKEPYRALYVKQFRNQNNTLLHAFDLGGGTKPIPVRNTTTTPTQALIMINGDYVLARAEQFAKRLNGMTLPDRPALVRRAIRLAWNREPEADELTAALAFLGDDRTEAEVAQGRLIDFCHVLFNSNEFLYLN